MEMDSIRDLTLFAADLEHEIVFYIGRVELRRP
jgi:hypothetical protein